MEAVADVVRVLGRCIAAHYASVPGERYSPEYREHCVETLLAGAAAISRDLENR